jgi:hypothetical protein
VSPAPVQIGNPWPRPAERARTAVAALALLGFLAAPGAAGAGCDDAVSPIESGFGAPGPHEIARREVPNPAWGGRPVTVHRPDEGHATSSREPTEDALGARWPVVFFAHGLGATQPLHYQQWIDHMTSRGFAVVYAPYPTAAVTHERRYQVLWEGFEAGLRALGPSADASRVGFVGHSYGGGAIPSLAHRGLVERGWGSAGAFVVVMAPWYVLAVEPAKLAELPSHTRLLVQVYDRERINDHQIAIDLFEAVALPSAQKLFVTLRSDERDGCELRAGHTTPATDGIRGRLDALDHHGVFRLVDAVAADALFGDPLARTVAFGADSAEHLDMGRWSDGSPVRPPTSTRSPDAERPPESFRFRARSRNFWIRADDLEF